MAAAREEHRLLFFKFNLAYEEVAVGGATLELHISIHSTGRCSEIFLSSVSSRPIDYSTMFPVVIMRGF